MGHFNRISSLKDLPPDKVFIAYVKQAAKLNEDGVPLPPKAKASSAGPVEVPGYVKKALQKNKKAKDTFDAFSPSHKREYMEWITEAKTEPTRNKRIETMIGWLQEGKARNWRYEVSGKK